MHKRGTVAGVPFYTSRGFDFPPDLGVGERYGIIIYKPFSRDYDIATLCAVLGVFDETYKYIICLEAEKDQEFIESYLRKRKAVLLYDATGEHDDKAMLSSADIDYKPSPFPFKSHPRWCYPVLRKEHSYHISTEKQARIVQSARVGALNKYIVLPNGFASGEMPVSHIAEMARAISFGKKSLLIDEDDLERLKSDSIEWEHELPSLRLVLDGAVKASTEDLAFAHTCQELHDLYKIWERCFAAAKFPMCFDEKAEACNAEILMQIGCLLGVDSYVRAYLLGVPIQDIFA